MISNKRWTIERLRRHKSAMGFVLVLFAMILNPATALAGTIRAVEIGKDEVTLRFDDLVPSPD